MQPLLTDAQRELLGTARRLATTFAERAERHDREASFPFENFADLHRAGFLALALPVELGGRGLSLYDFCLLQETLGRGCGATALGTNMHWYNLGAGCTCSPMRSAAVSPTRCCARARSSPAASPSPAPASAHRR